MARYTVVWNDEALNQLANSWLKVADKASINSAVREIDACLAIDPVTKGLHVMHGLYDLAAPPLRVLFTVSEPDRIARVVHVQLHESPGG